MEGQTGGFEAWAVVEIMGHKQLAGRVTEQVIAGSAMLRIDIPEVNAHPAQTVFHGGAAVYAIHPCTEDVARQAAERLRAVGTNPFPVYIPDLADARKVLADAARIEAARQLPPGAEWAFADDKEQY